MKVTRSRYVSTPMIDTEKIEIDTVFTGTIGSYSGTFLRTYDSVVMLENPRRTWDEPFPTVINYCEVDAEVIISEKE